MLVDTEGFQRSDVTKPRLSRDIVVYSLCENGGNQIESPENRKSLEKLIQGSCIIAPGRTYRSRTTVVS